MACLLAAAVPGRVNSPRVGEHGSHHVKLLWEKPDKINGIPRGYVIRYRDGQCCIRNVM